MKKIKDPKTWWTSQTPKQRKYFIFALIFSVVILVLSTFFLSARELGIISLSDYLYGEGVSGWSWLKEKLATGGIKWLETLGIIAIAFMLSFIINLVIGLITWKGKRSKTIGSLIKSLIKYAICILAGGFVLSVWGVDIASIVAGLGIITLIVGLGCQSLINDIVSGIFIIFDDFFDVGDIVVIDGFRGTVTEIGLRSTKLTDWAGNIKGINNSQIMTVTNLSRLATSIVVNFTVDRTEDVERVEAVLASNLPLIKKKLPKVVGKISYIGVSNLKESGIELAFSLTCDESDRYQVNRDMMRELFLVMKANNIKVPFSKIAVYQEDEKEGKKSTEKEKETADKLIGENR